MTLTDAETAGDVCDMQSDAVVFVQKLLYLGDLSFIFREHGGGRGTVQAAWADLLDDLEKEAFDQRRDTFAAQGLVVIIFFKTDIVYEDPDIDIIINLTVPVAHEEVTVKVLECGKHVYTEKPLACSREGMRHIMEVAKKCGKRVGCAPDSFMSVPA